MPRPDDPLLAGLVDDAALFPPGNAPMDEAVRAHLDRRDEAWSDAVGVFVCPASRVAELAATLAPYQAVLISMVYDPAQPGIYDAVRAAAAFKRVTVVGFEAPLAVLGEGAAQVIADDLLGLKHNGVYLGFLEVPRDAPAAALDFVVSSGWKAAKYRTGGVTAEAHPSESDLAAFLVGCAERRLKFKLTAGLHHAVRTTTAEGFEQHGVLNVLVATQRTLAGRATREETADVLAERDARVLAKEVRSWTKRDGEAVRRRFRSFGCCGVAEPLDELRELGVLKDGGA